MQDAHLREERLRAERVKLREELDTALLRAERAEEQLADWRHDCGEAEEREQRLREALEEIIRATNEHARTCSTWMGPSEIATAALSQQEPEG